jgi:hypothetical protein
LTFNGLHAVISQKIELFNGRHCGSRIHLRMGHHWIVTYTVTSLLEKFLILFSTYYGTQIPIWEISLNA